MMFFTGIERTITIELLGFLCQRTRCDKYFFVRMTKVFTGLKSVILKSEVILNKLKFLIWATYIVPLSVKNICKLSKIKVKSLIHYRIILIFFTSKIDERKISPSSFAHYFFPFSLNLRIPQEDH